MPKIKRQHENCDQLNSSMKVHLKNEELSLFSLGATYFNVARLEAVVGVAVAVARCEVVRKPRAVAVPGATGILTMPQNINVKIKKSITCFCDPLD